MSAQHLGCWEEQQQAFRRSLSRRVTSEIECESKRLRNSKEVFAGTPAAESGRRPGRVNRPVDDCQDSGRAVKLRSSGVCGLLLTKVLKLKFDRTVVSSHGRQGIHPYGDKTSTPSGGERPRLKSRMLTCPSRGRMPLLPTPRTLRHQTPPW